MNNFLANFIIFYELNKEYELNSVKNKIEKSYSRIWIVVCDQALLCLPTYCTVITQQAGIAQLDAHEYVEMLFEFLATSAFQIQIYKILLTYILRVY